MTEKLGPDEGINALQHPDCRACTERKRLSLGQVAEIEALKKKLAEQVPAPTCNDLKQGLQPEQQVEVGGAAAKCICVKEGWGYDGYDPVTAGPCPVHSSEYFVPPASEITIEKLRRQRDQLRGALEALQNGPDTLTPDGLRIVLAALYPAATPTQLDQPEAGCEG